MPLEPSKTLQFTSWEALRLWLPEATENQLMTVFVWSADLQPPADEAPQLAAIRRDAFEFLVRRTRDRLRQFLIKRCGCRDFHLADDVVQQVLVKLFLRADQYDPRRSFWGWLFRIARNDYIDTLRRVRPGVVGVGQAGKSDDEGWLDRQMLVTETPASSLLDKEQRQRLEEAIQALPRLQRSIVHWKREKVPGKEIAQRLGISQAYVSQLYYEAEEALRERLGD